MCLGSCPMLDFFLLYVGLGLGLRFSVQVVQCFKVSTIPGPMTTDLRTNPLVRVNLP